MEKSGKISTIWLTSHICYIDKANCLYLTLIEIYCAHIARRISTVGLIGDEIGRKKKDPCSFCPLLPPKNGTAASCRLSDWGMPGNSAKWLFNHFLIVLTSILAITEEKNEEYVFSDHL